MKAIMKALALGEKDSLNLKHTKAISLHYDYTEDCKERGCDEICRCGQIENPRFADPNPEIIASYFGYAVESLLDAYCIERLVNKYAQASNFELIIDPGYYGQEIDSVILTKKLEDKLYKFAHNLSQMTPREKIEHILQEEYGYLLEELENRDWELREVPRAQIIAGNEDYYKKLDSNIVDKYKDWSGPIGVCLEKKGKLKLIDGYHRYASSSGKDKVQVIVAKERLNLAGMEAGIA